RTPVPALGEGARQEHQPDAEAGQGQGGSGGQPGRPGPPPGTDGAVQATPVPVLVGRVLPAVPHQARQLLLEVIHGSFFTSPARRSPRPAAAATVRRRVPSANGRYPP